MRTYIYSLVPRPFAKGSGNQAITDEVVPGGIDNRDVAVSIVYAGGLSQVDCVHPLHIGNNDCSLEEHPLHSHKEGSGEDVVT